MAQAEFRVPLVAFILAMLALSLVTPAAGTLVAVARRARHLRRRGPWNRRRPEEPIPAALRSEQIERTGKRFRVEQIHRHGLRDGAVVGHLARRDDLGMLQQLGHLPPRPRSMVRLLWWRLSVKTRRASAEAILIGETAASEMTAFLAARGN